jgi:hypothetical protein
VFLLGNWYNGTPNMLFWINRPAQKVSILQMTRRQRHKWDEPIIILSTPSTTVLGWKTYNAYQYLRLPVRVPSSSVTFKSLLARTGPGCTLGTWLGQLERFSTPDSLRRYEWPHAHLIVAYVPRLGNVSMQFCSKYGQMMMNVCVIWF